MSWFSRGPATHVQPGVANWRRVPTSRSATAETRPGASWITARSTGQPEAPRRTEHPRRVTPRQRDPASSYPAFRRHRPDPFRRILAARTGRLRHRRSRERELAPERVGGNFCPPDITELAPGRVGRDPNMTMSKLLPSTAGPDGNRNQPELGPDRVSTHPPQLDVSESAYPSSMEHPAVSIARNRRCPRSQATAEARTL